MSRDDILRMAAKSNIALYGMGLEREKFIRHLEQFAALVASAEREACLKDLKNVHSTFDSLPVSPEITLIRKFCSIFFEAFTVAINERIKP